MTCVWEADPACLGDKWDAFDISVKERSLMLATSALQMLTNYRVGTCPITIRPCVGRKLCACGDFWNPYIWLPGGLAPYRFGIAVGGWQPNVDENGVWRNTCGCGAVCTPQSEIDIPGPVGYIEEFLINGSTVDLANGDWRLDDGHLLVWQGVGPSPIPTVQNLDLPDTEVGTYSITYSKSYPVAEDGRLAVAYLAIEFAQACVPKGKCSLPRGVTNVVRNGVSFTIQAGLFPNGLTGIDIVDQFILKWNPVGSPTRNAQVFNPNKRGPRRTSAVPVGSPFEGSI
jgi:hypothetical protein